MNDVTQGAASAAEQLSSSTELLSRLAQELQSMAGRFRVVGTASRAGHGETACASGGERRGHRRVS